MLRGIDVDCALSKNRRGIVVIVVPAGHVAHLTSMGILVRETSRFIAITTIPRRFFERAQSTSIPLSIARSLLLTAKTISTQSKNSAPVIRTGNLATTLPAAVQEMLAVA
jgi:hypothetical protein